MHKTLLKMTMGLGIMVLAAQKAHARNCAPRDEVIKRLTETYGETRQGIGIARQGAVMELYASDQSGGWTNTATLPDGMTCFVASGQAYEMIAEALPPNV
ncbi:hypothetical protein [Ruegeria sp. Alg231-54]|uniref:hypothetical protein n=1 Tax=Ruegeria sp. Alg231-54 TaxID=1922221 RepID=UPI000D54EE0C|nr:hypothetical protein [Ruegeria sp. Alg231-54]